LAAAHASSSPPKRSLRGAFITFEGIDGCGKTTQARILAQRLRDYDFPVVETREPGGTAIGRGVRGVLLDPANRTMTPTCELLLYLADRVQHIAEVIRPALAREDVVICDRFHDATLAYQHYGRGLDFAALEELIAAEIATTPPVLTLWLDTDVEIARQRIARREAEAIQGVGRPGGGAARPDPRAEARLEQEHPRFQLRVRMGYQALHERHPERIVRIDADSDTDSVRDAVWDVIVRRFHVL
jgi:dTMP kinase